MDIKELNKPQLIMLAVMLSFVTSIATGITTVSLMQQAPSSVTVPINRIIRETVERIVPVEAGKPKVQTVIIKEEDLVVDAIAKNQSAIFSITKETSIEDEIDGTQKIIEVSAGRGFVITKERIVVADATLVPGKGVYYVKNDSGKFKADFVSANEAGFAFLKIGVPLDEKNNSELNVTRKVAFKVPDFGDIEKMKAGQKIIVLGSSISSFIYNGSKDLKISNPKGGSLVVNLDGDVLGIVLSGTDTSFATIALINTVLNTPTPTPDSTLISPSVIVPAPKTP